MPNPLRTLNEYGQSVWLDFVSRDLLKSGGLAKLIAEDGLRGVTSNPSIFEKAIGHGDDYDALIAQAEASGDLDPGALFEDLAVRDIQEGADTLNSVYEQTQRRDGFISLEVSPYLAMNTHETIEEARRLWREVNRRNLMVKVPGTKPGLTAIRTLIGEGINVNVTLLFSQQVYADVAEAYISGLEAFAKKGVVVLKADWTSRDAVIAEMLGSFGRSGVPLYLLYAPASAGGSPARAPAVLPQILTEGAVIDAVNKI